MVNSGVDFPTKVLMNFVPSKKLLGTFLCEPVDLLEKYTYNYPINKQLE